MANGNSWSLREVELCVADYLRMLTLELNGQRYSKTAHAKTLMARLDGRNRAAVEFKHCNISAILIEFGYPPINGYKRRDNYQALLVDAVAAQLATHLELQAAVQAAVVRPAIEATLDNASRMWISPPAGRKVAESPAPYFTQHAGVRRDFLAQEAQNRSLGRAGELLVVELESRRLHEAGKKTLANRVEHVAATQGDGLGFDVLSFDVDGRERLIEVKTTAFGQLTPFYVSRNELARSSTDADSFHLYRLFDFRRQPRLFDLPGPISTHCRLDAVSFSAQIQHSG
ncbi:MAG: DUF3883 domain-containing protein [Xanthomonadales bacterium]|nr:DUF3883 domain-containing protein [Xanthomonadales bacterium]